MAQLLACNAFVARVTWVGARGEGEKGRGSRRSAALPLAPELPGDHAADDPDKQEGGADHREDAPEVPDRHAVGVVGRAGDDRLLAARSAERGAVDEEEHEESEKRRPHGGPVYHRPEGRGFR